MLVQPQELPCPNCSKLIWHSFIGAPSDHWAFDPIAEPIVEIWTDGYIPAVDDFTDSSWPILPEYGEFIARCPKCSAVYPDHFVPWTEDEVSGDPISAFILAGASSRDSQPENSLSMANLSETIRYIAHLEANGLLATWECWTAIQQVILLANKATRETGVLPESLSSKVRGVMRVMISSLKGALDGPFARRSLLSWDSERINENSPNDWVTFSEMHRIAGDFENASKFLNYASNEPSSDFKLIDEYEFDGFEFERPRVQRQRARVELMRKLINSRSDSVASSSSLSGAETSSTHKRVYTYYINDQGSDIGVYGQVANSQEEVEAALKSRGFQDFFLFEDRELGPDESERAADFRIKLSPHLGPNWLPVVNAIQLVLQDKRSEFFSVQTLAKKYDFDPHRSPYIQGMVLADGRFHLEAPRFFWEEGGLSEAKIQQLQFIGWNLPGDTDSTYNFWRAFDYGWNPRSVAEFALETLTSVFEVTESDFFDFGSVWQPEAIWRLRELYRVPIADSNPKGSIFRIPDNDKFRVDSFDEQKEAEHRQKGEVLAEKTVSHAGSMSKSFDFFLYSLGLRDRTILFYRLLLKPKRTLDAIGIELNLTRERVRQIEKSIRQALAKWISTSSEIDAFSDKIIEATGVVSSSSAVYQQLPEALDEVELEIAKGQLVAMPTWQLVENLTGAFQNDGDWFFAPNKDAVIELFRSKFFALSGGKPFVTPRQVLDLFDGWGTASPEELLVWAQSIGYKIVFGALVAPDIRSMNDLSAVALEIKGTPMSTSELHESVAPKKSVKSLANQITGDPRIQRVGPESWGLVEWGDEEFTSIRDAILLRVDRTGTYPVDELVAELTSKFGVAESSVRAYAASWPLRSEGGVVSRQQEDITPQGRPFPKSRGSFISGGKYAFRTRVTVDHLRGSGSQFPTALAVSLGNSIGKSKEFSSVKTGNLIRLSWNGNQATISTLKAELELIGAKVGDDVAAIFDAGTVRFEKLEPPSGEPFGDLGRLCLIPTSEKVSRVTVARSIGLDETAVWDEILQSATARRDPELEYAVKQVMDHLLDPA